jgi:hypothetical protein
MAPNSNAWAHLGALGALGAYFPLSAPRARACNDYTELAPDAPTAPNGCELIHDWQAEHPRKSRWERGVSRSLPPSSGKPVCDIAFYQNKDARIC